MRDLTGPLHISMLMWVLHLPNSQGFPHNAQAVLRLADDFYLPGTIRGPGVVDPYVGPDGIVTFATLAEAHTYIDERAEEEHK